MTHYGVATDYEWTGKRSRITVWSGSTMSTFEAEGIELPKGDGYMLTTYNDGDKVRVTCPTPRNDDNYTEVDEAIDKAMNAYEEKRGSVRVGNSRY